MSTESGPRFSGVEIVVSRTPVKTVEVLRSDLEEFNREQRTYVPVINRGNLYVVFENSIDSDGVRKWHFNKALWVEYNLSRGMSVNKMSGAYKTILWDYILRYMTLRKSKNNKTPLSNMSDRKCKI